MYFVPSPMPMHVPVLSFSSIARAVELRKKLCNPRVLFPLMAEERERGHIQRNEEMEEGGWKTEERSIGSEIKTVQH